MIVQCLVTQLPVLLERDLNHRVSGSGCQWARETASRSHEPELRASSSEAFEIEGYHPSHAESKSAIGPGPGPGARAGPRSRCQLSCAGRGRGRNAGGPLSGRHCHGTAVTSRPEPLRSRVGPNPPGVYNPAGAAGRPLVCGRAGPEGAPHYPAGTRGDIQTVTPHCSASPQSA